MQIVVGELQWRTQLPWWLVLIHVSLGALALGAAAAFGWTLAVSRRPARRLR
jgi:heme A synthase